MNLLTQLHIWKLRYCAARHEKRAKALKKRLLSEIRQLNHEIRKEEKNQQICSRLASLRAFRAERGKVSTETEKGQERAYTTEELAFNRLLMNAKPVSDLLQNDLAAMNRSSYARTGGWGEL